jgi:hypothetical protein
VPLETFQATLSKAQQEKLQLFDSYRLVFRAPGSEEVLEDLVRASGYDQHGYERGDPYTTAFNAGKRALMIHILRRVQVGRSPGLLNQVLEAYKQVEEHEDA